MGLPFWVQLGTILKDQLRLCGGQLLTTYPANTLNMIMNLDVCMGPRKNDSFEEVALYQPMGWFFAFFLMYIFGTLHGFWGWTGLWSEGEGAGIIQKLIFLVSSMPFLVLSNIFGFFWYPPWF